ncbi:nitroreductase family protein [uncultured Methanobrevibacter sp.]|nr:nitroreductase family protein [uncultured Methanobrevibacter sp.]
MILEAGRYAPTGANSQNVKYTILGSKQKEAEEICVNLFRKGKKVGNLSSYLRRIEVTDDFFFKGAPLVIVVSSKSSINAGLASAYMEIMANSLGLGVLYSGFFVMCTKLSRKLRNLIELEKGYDVVSCMVIGYPNVKYHRVVPRKDLQVNRL